MQCGSGRRRMPASMSAAIATMRTRRWRRDRRRWRPARPDRHPRPGRADKQGRLSQPTYAALEEDERRSGARFRMVVLHDAEDMVDPAALAHGQDAGRGGFRPAAGAGPATGLAIAGHYVGEFAEVHGKTMVVRDALGAGLPGGVGCAIDRDILAILAAQNEGEAFRPDRRRRMQLGLVAALGGRSPSSGRGRRIAPRRDPRIFPRPPVGRGAAEDPLGPRDRPSELGPARLAWRGERPVDADARPARSFRHCCSRSAMCSSSCPVQIALRQSAPRGPSRSPRCSRPCCLAISSRWCGGWRCASLSRPASSAAKD